MLQLEENKGIPRRILFMMAAMAGLTVANLYYNQPLLELVRAELGVSEVEANLVTVVTQIGYALGLCLIIPLGDLYSRRHIITVNMLVAALMALTIATAGSIVVIWAASLIMGACSVIPQLFMPIAGQYSRPENKARNMGYVLSGLLTGILASRVISGFVGDWLGWRAMFFIAAVLMVGCLLAIQAMLPAMKQNFSGSWAQLMGSVLHIVASNRRIRIYSVRAGFAFGSMLAIWSCLAFHLSCAPFNAGADMIGVLGLCGVVGAVAASGMGKFVPRFGIRRFSIAGALLQVVAWAVAWLFGDSYAGLIVAIILVDIGLQCLQLSNQSGCLQEVPEASNRANTIFMTTYFVCGAFGTFCSALGWENFGWCGVCIVGIVFTAISLTISFVSKY